MDPSEPSRPNEKAPRKPAARRPPPSPAAGGERAEDEGVAHAAPEEGAAPASIRLEAAPLLVAARFRGVLITSRLLVADLRLRRRSGAAAAFHIGADRGADAPVNPAYFAGAADAARHPLLELDARAASLGEPSWVLSLGAAMRAELHHGAQRLELRPDPPDGASGAARAPLTLPSGAVLRVVCGEMVFEVRAAGPHAPLPRPWLAPAWRREGKYLAGAALALLMVVAILFAIPPDPRSLSLDDIGRTIRMDPSWAVPPVVPDPPPTAGAHDHATAGGGGRAAAGPSGKFGDKHAAPANRHLAVKGTAIDPTLAARRAADDAAHRGILGLLRPEAGSALALVLSDGPALGDHATDVLANLDGTKIAAAYGGDGLSSVGTGAGGGGTGLPLIGKGELNTIGLRGHGHGAGPGWGDKPSRLGPKTAATLPSILPGIVGVRGALDKEIVRRIVRLHLNEVRYCYEEQLPRHPGLAGRLVVQFAIAGNGQVFSSIVQSSTLAEPRVGMCVTQAVRRWEFPRPQGGGMVQVSYPFQLQPAGGS